MNELGNLIMDFIDQESWEDSQRFLEANHALLMTDAADAEFEPMLAGASTTEDRRILQTHRVLLGRARQIGIAAAFEELIESRRDNPNLPLVPVDLVPVLLHLRTLTPARLRAFLDESPAMRDELILLGLIQKQQNTSMESIILAFINAQSWREKHRLVVENPRALFSPGAVVWFEEALHRARGNEVDTMVLQAHQQLLTRCQEIGVGEAFEEAETALDDARRSGHDMTPPR